MAWICPQMYRKYWGRIVRRTKVTLLAGSTHQFPIRRTYAGIRRCSSTWRRKPTRRRRRISTGKQSI